MTPKYYGLDTEVVKKAFGYLRVSGKGQVDGDGFPRQLQAVKDYASAHQIRVAKVFREEGVSGTIETMDRPAWQSLMTELHADGIRTVLIEKLDRLARDLMVQETIIAHFGRHGFELISVAEPDLMANDPTRVLMRQLMGAVAQYDKAQIVAKLRGARMRARLKNDGRCEGRKPYGFRQGEPETIARMRELRAEGLGFDRIARQLNAEGFKPRSGTRWHGFAVNKILSRPD